jgi:sec-independent protein translocase protein TatC
VDGISGFFDHLGELQRRLKWIVVVLVAFFIISITIELVPVDVGGVPLAYPTPNVFNATALQFFNKMVADLKPANVSVIVTSPLDGVVVEMKIGLFLSVALSMPVILYELGGFIAPALKRREKRFIIRTAGPASVLFVLGALFAYVFILPFVFDFLYSIGGAISDEQFLQADLFVDFVLMFMLAFGLVFELPVVMVGITALGVVKPSFWKEYWRYSLAGILIFGAVITPDGSGVTMILVALPMIVLYVLGYLVSRRYEKPNT